MSIVRQLIECGIVKYGDFKLKSGANSKIYFDLRSIIANPSLTNQVCWQLQLTILKELKDTFDIRSTKEVCIVGVPTGAVPIAAILSHNMELPIAMVRDAPKDHGLGKQIEGSDAKHIILVEDVITTGGSVEKFAKILEANGKKIILIVCILDREAGGVTDLQSKGYHVAALTRMSEFVPPPRIQNWIDLRTKRKSNLIVALDNPDSQINLDIAYKVVSYVCAFKLHWDLYQFRDDSHRSSFIYQIEYMSTELGGIAIIEDRKFADIAAISLKQWQALPQTYRKIINTVTVHPIAGPDVLEVLSHEVGVLVIHKLSTENNLTIYYAKDVEYMVEKLHNPNIVGFVSQKKVMDGNYSMFPYLTFSPGVNLDKTTDGLGQLWTADKNTDFVIVGRGITEAEDPVEAAKRYREHFYQNDI
jgi:orotate phosphoribosyltransferase/orotidine 5'-phosphate decarboxylase subfamily 1